MSHLIAPISVDFGSGQSMCVPAKSRKKGEGAMDAPTTAQTTVHAHLREIRQRLEQRCQGLTLWTMAPYYR